MLILPVTAFFVTAATAPVNTSVNNNNILLSAFNSSPSPRANVELVTYGDPQSSLCNAKFGRPGGVYVCPGSNFTPSVTEQCKWHPPPPLDLSVCHNFDMPLPRSIGPDPGGYCILFTEKGCKHGKAVLQLGNKVYNTLGCPGLNSKFELGAVASLECWPLSQRW